MQELSKNTIRNAIHNHSVSFPDIFKNINKRYSQLTGPIRKIPQLTRIKILSAIICASLVAFSVSDNVKTEYWLHEANVPIHFHETVIFLSLTLILGAFLEIIALLYTEALGTKADWVISPLTKIYIASFFSAVVFIASEDAAGSKKIIATLISSAIMFAAALYAMYKLWRKN